MHETRNCQWTRHFQCLSIWECQMDTMLQVEMWNSVQKTRTRSQTNDKNAIANNPKAIRRSNTASKCG